MFVDGGFEKGMGGWVLGELSVAYLWSKKHKEVTFRPESFVSAMEQASLGWEGWALLNLCVCYVLCMRCCL